MKPVCQGFVGSAQLGVVSVVGKLFGVLGSCWHVDWAAEALVGVALLMSELLNFILAHASRVHGHVLVHWESSGASWIVVGDHEEVEACGPIVFDNSSVYH